MDSDANLGTAHDCMTDIRKQIDEIDKKLETSYSFAAGMYELLTETRLVLREALRILESEYD